MLSSVEAAVGVLALLCVVAFRLWLPPPTAVPTAGPRGEAFGHLGRHLRDPGVRRLCLSSFVLTARCHWCSSPTGRAQASAMYLLAYCAGSSIGGWIGGWIGGFAFEGGGWPAGVAHVSSLLTAALVLALLLLRTPPLAPAPPASAAGRRHGMNGP